VALAERAASPDVVPGLTIHQAKGREWPRVGVSLSDAEASRLAHGLAEINESDRRSYVGLTRARRSTVLA
jgi:DNA helicase-2/ATP-dependent DNA helicase PcrA